MLTPPGSTGQRVLCRGADGSALDPPFQHLGLGYEPPGHAPEPNRRVLV